MPTKFISSSLGKARRVSIIVLPVLFEGQTKAVIELATLQNFGTGSLAFLDLLTQSIGAVFNTIEATMRTEGLLTQSQQLTVELQSRQSELQQTNEELGMKARLLAEQNAEVERKNTEVEQARRALEEKAAELALTSKYKSEFLANMSHELRTPLNSILILSQQLAGNTGGNLSDKQVEFSRNINSSGSDLLNLINDILDLSKIESGTVTVEVEEISFAGLRDTIDRNFRHVAEAKNLPFHVRFFEDLPRSMHTDPKRLQQILKNLLSNAVKFTARGHVEVRVSLATRGWSGDHPVLNVAPHVLAFAVEDTGIGVAQEKQRLIFEASSRPTPDGPASMAAPVSASPSAVSWPCYSAAKSSSRASSGRAALSLSTCRCTTAAQTSRRSPSQPPASQATWPARSPSCPSYANSTSRTTGTPSTRATPYCSSSRTIRTMRASSSGWRATRVSKASSP